MISINMPVVTKDDIVIGQAVVTPDGKIEMYIRNMDLLKEWIHLWTVGMSPGLKLDIHLIPAEEAPRG